MLRPCKRSDAAKILTWSNNEREFLLWTADRYDHHPITAEDRNRRYDPLRVGAGPTGMS